jgi:hypothetical protein
MIRHRSSICDVERAARILAIGCLLISALAACNTDKLLNQEAPSRVEASSLDDPANARLIVNGAVGDFECALAQTIVAGGLVGDELIDAQLGAAGWDLDRRTMSPVAQPWATNTCQSSAQIPGIYTPLALARFQADDALRRLEAWTDAQVPGRGVLIATAAAYAGYSLVLMGEVMCSSAIDLGPELSPTQIFALAEARFTKAIAAATAATADSTKNMALVGRARARLRLKKYAEAKADAQLVPNNFLKIATYSGATLRRENLVWTQLFRGNYASVETVFRNLTYGGVSDPRVSTFAALTSSGAAIVGHDNSTPIWRTTKYAGIGAPIPIARWAEAQLIIAEANARAGDAPGAVAIIDELHRRANIPLYSVVQPGATAAQALTQVIEERRRELFLEGQRLGDMIQYALPLYPATGVQYPPKAGGVYSSQVCFPLPDVERLNNPCISGGKCS